MGKGKKKHYFFNKNNVFIYFLTFYLIQPIVLTQIILYKNSNIKLFAIQQKFEHKKMNLIIMQIFEILLQGRRKDTWGSESMSLYFCATTGKDSCFASHPITINIRIPSCTNGQWLMYTFFK